MKRNLLYGVLAVAGLSLLACQNMEQDLSEAVNVPDTRTVFYAEIEQSEDTKVYADEDLMILWHADDRISIFNRYTYNLEYRFEGETGANAGTFWAVPNDDMIVGNALDAIYAVYPYDEQTSISNQGMLSVMLPEKQEYAENSFGRGANYMVSSTYNNRLLFRNVCGYLSVKLYGENVSVSRITLRGNAGEKLSGLGSIEAPVGGIPVLTMSEDAGEEVSLVCPQPVKLGATSDAYTEFWFAIPPTEFEQGLTVTVYDDGFGSFEKSTSTPISVTRSNLSRLSPVEAEIVTPEQPNNEIWYTTTDGEVVAVNYPAAFNVNLVSNTYENGLGILRFDGDLVSTGDPYGGSSSQAPFNHADNLKSISLPESVDVLGCMTFCYCAALDHVILPSHLTTLGYNVFYGCRSLTSLYIPETDDIYSVFGDCPSIASFEGPYASEDGRFLVKENKLYLVAPYQLTSCVVPDSIESINDAAFRGCKELVEVTLPSGLTEIPGFLFDGCWNLQHVTIPEGIKTVGSYAFAYCSLLRNIYLPDSVETIDFYAFTGCSSLTSFTIPASIKTISRDNPFAGCSNLAKFKGPYVSEDGRSLIVDGVLISVAPAGLTSYTVPSGVTVLGARLFENDSKLETIIIPEGVTKSYYGAFSGCSSLRSLTMPSTWVEFDGDQFFGCSSLESLTVLSPVPPTRFLNSAYSFLKDYYGTIACTIYVPAESVEAYKAAEVWSDYADQIQAIPGPAPAANEIWYTTTDGEIVTINDASAFNANVVSNTYEDGKGVITFDANLTSIGNLAFTWSSKLESIHIPDSVNDIETTAFYSCLSLSSFAGKFATSDGRLLIINGEVIAFAPAGITSYDIPEGVTVIGNSAFNDAQSLQSLTIPEGVTTIEGWAFSGSGLTSINIPESVTSFQDAPFYACTHLEEFTGKFASDDGRLLVVDGDIIGSAMSGLSSYSIPDGLTSIGYGSFGYSGLTSITIPEGVWEIDYDAFFACSKLESIVIPSTIEKIRNGAFWYCENLTSMTVFAMVPPTIPSELLPNSNDCLIYVPAGAVEAYKAADNWSAYAERIHSLGDAQVAVDLGLPSGVKWASYNVGALSPEGAGAFFNWGDTTPKSSFSYDNFTASKYNEADGLTVLEPEDDAATAYLGEGWRMPTHAEQVELINNCSRELTSVNGVNGCLLTSRKNGNSIFLPFVDEDSKRSFYWSSDLSSTNEGINYNLAWCIGIDSTGPTYCHDGYGHARFFISPIRPVTE